MKSRNSTTLIKRCLVSAMISVCISQTIIVSSPAHAKDNKNPVSGATKTEALNKGQNASAGFQISTFELANGMKVVVIPDNRAPVVTHMVWYKVGSAEDPVGKSGIAHFLEHLMFKGTKTVPANQFSAKIAEIGGQENAFTSVDYTSYYQKVSPDALKMMMAYEADRMENLVLSDKDIIPERSVVLEERRSRVSNNPGAILSETLESVLFLHHPYGNPIIGYENEIRRLNRQDAIAFYNRYYTPNNAVLVVSGDIDEQTVHAYAKQTYGKVKRRAEPGVRQRVVEPDPVAARSVSYEDERVTSPSFTRMYLVPSYNTAEPGEAEALDILGTILAGTSIGRLYRELVIDNEFATNASSGYRGGAFDLTRLTISASPRGDFTIAQLEANIDRVLDDIIKNGVQQDELDHARNTMIKAEVYARDSQTTMARIVGAVFTAGGDLTDVVDWTSRLKKVTVEDVNAVARKYLLKRRSVTGYLLPKKHVQESDNS